MKIISLRKQFTNGCTENEGFQQNQPTLRIAQKCSFIRCVPENVQADLGSCRGSRPNFRAAQVGLGTNRALQVPSPGTGSAVTPGDSQLLSLPAESPVVSTF